MRGSLNVVRARAGDVCSPQPSARIHPPDVGVPVESNVTSASTELRASCWVTMTRVVVRVSPP